MRARIRLIALVCLVGVLASCGGDGGKPRTSRVTTAGSFAALAPDVYEPCGVQGAGEAVWVLGCSGRLVRIPRGSSAVRAVQGDIAALDGLGGGEIDTVWALLATGEGKARRGSLARIDPDTGAVLATVSLGSSIAADAVVARATVWVGATDGALYAVDGGEARRVSSGPPLIRVLTDGTRLWTLAENGDVVARDAAGEPARMFAGVMPDAIGAAVGLGHLWVASADQGLVRLDPATGNADRIAMTGTVNAIEPCGDAIWVSQPDFGVRALDDEGRVTRSVRLPVAPHYLACVTGRLVVVSEDGRIGTV